eukprot:TCALIF_11982-PA protein Name:"Similar to SLC35G1 Solute carrier family 35 member G1 (Homo sapiens)" AED:0.17 eAED:0.17 QI:0/0.66/0.25/0.75/1/1/4/34/446
MFFEETNVEKSEGAKRKIPSYEKKLPIAKGFNAILESVKGRSHEGYTKLDQQEPPRDRRQTHFVQRPNNTKDVLDSLNGDFEGDIVERRISIRNRKDPDDYQDGSQKALDYIATDDESDLKKRHDPTKCDSHMKFVGIFLAAISGLFFTLCSVTVKLLPRIDPSEVLLFRAIVQLFVIVPIMICAKANPLGPKGLRVVVYIQGIIGCLTVNCIFIGFARLPVGDAATIIFCSPIFVMVFSHVILREHCGLYRVLVISILMMGVVLIAKPPFLMKMIFQNDNTALTQFQSNDYDALGYGAAFFGTLLTASNFVCMRKLREVHFSVLIFAFSIMSGILSSAVVALTAEFNVPRTSEEWTFAVLVGVFGVLGQSLLAIALKYESAGVVSVTRSMDIAVAYLIQISYFGDIPIWTSILGALIVILAVFTMAMEEGVLILLSQHCGGPGWC